MANRVQDRFQVNVTKIGQLVLNCVIVGKPNNPGLPEPGDLQIALDTIKQAKSEMVIELFFERSYSYWENLYKKEKDILISSINKMMPEISPKNVSIFNLLFIAKNKDGKVIVDDQILESIWLYFHQMVRQCITYGLEKMGNSEAVTIGALKVSKISLTAEKAKWDALKK